MARILSILAAAVVILSAAAEIASFVIDHRSWIGENLEALSSYVTASREAKQPAVNDCEGACISDRPEAVQHGCDTVEPVSKKILCLITLPKAEPGCAKADCDKNGPGSRNPATKGNMAGLERQHH